MRRALMLIASVVVLAACNMAADAQESEGARPSGEGGVRTYDLSGFHSVSTAGPFNVIVKVGQAHSVRAEGDPDLLDRMKVEVEGGKLEIGTKKSWTGSFRHNGSKATVYVTMPAIQAASIAGSGDVRIDRVEGERFAASIAGSGDIEIAALKVGETKVSVAGSGAVRATGTSNNSSISIAGSGEVDLERVESRNASVSIAGSGDVRARAMETAKVSIMGSGDVTIAGPAKCSVSKMGSGSVRCTG